jgi:hypothetical protein
MGKGIIIFIGKYGRNAIRRLKTSITMGIVGSEKRMIEGREAPGPADCKKAPGNPAGHGARFPLESGFDATWVYNRRDIIRVTEMKLKVNHFELLHINEGN